VIPVFYSDLDVNLDGPLVVNKDAVLQALISLFVTGITERTFRPEIAGTLDDLLFEVCNEFTAFQIRHRLFESIGNWDNRVSVSSESEVTSDPDNNRYLVNLVLSIRGVGIEKSSIPLYLYRQ
jgi:phage baseplate assembly protein W